MVLFVFLIPFLVYLITLCPTVYVGDSGELIVAAWSLGIPHPPGMPIWCLLAHPFTRLPIGNVAWRVNLSSAFFSAAACVMIYLVIIELIKDGNSIPSVKGKSFAVAVASIIFGFTKTVWVNAVQAEVYGLLSFFVALEIYLLLRWEDSGRVGFLYLFAFIYGVSITNQYLVLILAPMYLCWIITGLLRERQARGVRNLQEMRQLALRLSTLILPFFLGLAFFLYLPIRSRTNPPIDWSNCETLRGFLNHITRRQYYENNVKLLGLYLPAGIQVQRPLASIGSFFYSIWIFLRVLFREFPWYINPFGWLGLVWLYRRSRRRFWLNLSGFLTTGPLLSFIFKQTLERETIYFITYLPCFIIFTSWIGIGLYSFKGAYKAEIGIIMVIVLAFSNLSYCDRSGVTLAYDYGINIYKTLPKDAILFTEGSPSTFIMMYLGRVEGMRPDVTLIDRRGNVFGDFYKFPKLMPKDMLIWRDKVEEALIAQTTRPIYYVYTLLGEKVKLTSVEFENIGLVEKVSKANEPPDLTDHWKNYRLNSLEDRRILYEPEARRLICEVYFHRAQDYFKVRDVQSALKYYKKASDVSNGWIPEIHNSIGVDYYKHNMFKEAKGEFELVLWRYRDSAPIHSNLGLCFMQLGDSKMAEIEFRRALEFDPRLHESHCNLGLIYFNQRRFEDALLEYKAALKLHPNYVDAFIGLGNSFYELGNNIDAINSYIAALKIEPQSRDAHRNLGVLLYYRIRDFPRAVHHLKEYLRLAPNAADRKMIQGEIDRVTSPIP